MSACTCAVWIIPRRPAAADWPFQQPRFLGRDITWQDWLALPRDSNR